MGYRSAAAQTLADLRILLQKLEQNRSGHDSRSFAELRRILLRKINILSRKVDRGNSEDEKSQGRPPAPPTRRAA